jgi:hypothetical protein
MGTQNVKSGRVGIIPTSQAPKGKLTPEEREAKFRDYRATGSQSKLAVRGDNDKAYYWARKDDMLEMSNLELRGFSIVKEIDIKVPKIKATGLQKDGTYVIGDVILMQRDKELDIFFEEENDRAATALIEGAKSNFIEDRKADKVPTFERDEANKTKTFH